MFLVRSPAPALAPFVAGYWFVEDIAGAHEGLPIRTSPHPGAVLSVNIGRPNAVEGGPLVPGASLLGVQTAARGWRSWSDTYFVMAMLTVRGLARLFPHTGPGSADALLDLGAMIGDAASHALAADVGAAWRPGAIAGQLDRWLLARLATVEPAPGLARFAAAAEVLRAGGTVEHAARHAEVTRRQLHRWFCQHIGVGPKQLMDLERFQASLQAVQREQGD
ncbi:MAG TPA: hypothetical protein VGB85_22665, partial [Nannocystis sp.]